MIQLTAKYYRRHFFGGTIYCEDDVAKSKDDVRLKEYINKALKKVASENFTLAITRLEGRQTLIIEKDYYNREANRDIVTILHFKRPNNYKKFEMTMREAKRLIGKFIEEDAEDE